MTLVIPKLFMQRHQQVKVSSYQLKYLNRYGLATVATVITLFIMKEHASAAVWLTDLFVIVGNRQQ